MQDLVRLACEVFELPLPEWYTPPPVQETLQKDWRAEVTNTLQRAEEHHRQLASQSRLQRITHTTGTAPGEGEVPNL